MTVLLQLIAIGEIYAREIKIASGEWAPYVSEEVKGYGILNQVITESFALEGINVTFVFYPWKRNYATAMRGEVDATGVWFYSAKRAKDFYYSDPLAESKHHFFHLKNYPFNWKTINDLRKNRIGGKIGSTKTEEFLAAEKAGILLVENVVSDKLAFKMLYNGRIDIYPQDIEVGFFVLHQLFTPEQVQAFTYHPKPLRQSPVYLLFLKKKKDSKQLLKAFNNGLIKLRQSGQYGQILKNSEIL